VYADWVTCCGHLLTSEFLGDRETVLSALRHDKQYGGTLKDHDALTAYCEAHPESDMGRYAREYAFRLDTEQYTYFLRLYPDGIEFDFELYPYRRDLLECHMKQAEKGIRFITPERKEKFRVPDGERIQITTSGAGTRVNTARYVDDCHFEVVTEYDSYLYHIHEFAEWLERHEGTVVPMRSTLPDQCYCVLPSSDEIIIVKKGESGYYRMDKYGHDRAEAQAIVDECNEIGGVTKAQAAAMLAGSMFGWEVPGADPKNYDEQCHLIKPKHSDRGDAR
ncbi:MAG: hypothetical protein K2K53_10215, partial [Oscillospiraceae bacterium]|nr:hypothetical protein [Oscillospiraceae bacterium]